MSKLKTNTIQHTGGSADNITLDNSQNVTIEGNATVDGTSTLTGNVTASGNLTVSGTTTISGYNPTSSRNNRNLIINGAMNVAQRGTSSTSTLYQTVDRFGLYTSGTDEAPTQSQVDIASGNTPYTLGFRKAYKVTNGNQTGGAGTSDYIMLRHKIESQDVAKSGWNYTSSSSNVTLSFWVKASVAQNYYFSVLSSDGTLQNYPMETGSLTANTWTKITKTIPGATGVQFNNDNGIGIELDWWVFAGTTYTSTPDVTLNAWAAYASGTRFPDHTSTWYTTNDATFEITGVQLEVGSAATDFEHRSYGDELIRCSRYHQSYSGDGVVIFNEYNRDNSNCWAELWLHTRMRSAPSYVISNLGAGAVTGGGSNDHKIVLQATNANTHFNDGTTWTASAEL